MKKILFLACFVLFAASCITQRRCYTKFPPAHDTLKIITIRDSIIYKPKLVLFPIPGRTVHDSIPIPCPPPTDPYIPDTARAETEFAKAKAWFDYPNIELELEQKNSILQIRLDSAIKELYHWQAEYNKITVTPQPVKVIPKIYKQALSICIFIFAAAFIFLGWKAFNFFKK